MSVWTTTRFPLLGLRAARRIRSAPERPGAPTSNDQGDDVERLIQRVVERCDWLVADLRLLLAGYEDVPLDYVADPARTSLRRAFLELWRSNFRRKGDQTVTYKLSILGRDAEGTYAALTQRDDTRAYDSLGNLVAAPPVDRSRRRQWEFRLTFDDTLDRIVGLSVHEVASPSPQG